MKLWAESDYKKDECPSINRLNDFLPYTFENIELITWKENMMKAAQGKKFKDMVQRTTKNNYKGVIQKDFNNNIIGRFFSVKEAVEKTGFGISGISRNCREETNSFMGYVWVYVKGKTLSKKVVIQKTLKGTLYKKYISISETVKQNSHFTSSSISQACKYKRKYKGFLWEFG